MASTSYRQVGTESPSKLMDVIPNVTLLLYSTLIFSKNTSLLFSKIITVPFGITSVTLLGYSALIFSENTSASFSEIITVSFGITSVTLLG